MWNEVYNFVMLVKHEYITKLGKYPEYKEYETENGKISTLEHMINELDSHGKNVEEFRMKIKYLQINQFNEFILLRYANFSSVLGGEEPISLPELFSQLDGFYRECRSIVIDLKRECIVTTPFKKFANINEWEENSEFVIRKEIENAKSVEITEKLDGSMQVARWYNGRIFMTGSQSMNLNDSWRLKLGYNMLMSQENYVRMLRENEDFTFIFEFIHLSDAHVVKYDKSQEGLYLIGIRNTLNGDQFSYKEVKAYADRYNILMTRIFDKTLDEVLDECIINKASECEGFVINIDGHMVKIKTDDYVNLHKILSKLSSINLVIKCVADGNLDDLLSKVPNAYHNRIMKVAKVTLKYKEDMEQKIDYYFGCAPKTTKKEFMVYVNENVPKKYAGYVRQKYNRREFSVLKSHGSTPRYIKLNEMGITNYKEFMEEE